MNHTIAWKCDTFFSKHILIQKSSIIDRKIKAIFSTYFMFLIYIEYKISYFQPLFSPSVFLHLQVATDFALLVICFYLCKQNVEINSQMYSCVYAYSTNKI